MNKGSNLNRRLSSSRADDTVVTYLHPSDEAWEAGQVVPVSHYLWLLRRSWLKIACAVALTTAAATVFCFSVKPIYESTARITIDQKIPSTAIGQEAATIGSSDVDQLMNTEIQIIQSDAVLRPVAEQFHMFTGYEDQDQHSTAGVRRDKSSSNAVSPSDAPVSLKKLTVSRIPTSLLIDISYRSQDPRKAALVANAIAQSYILRGMEMRARASMGLSTFMEKQIAELKKNMDDSQLALAGYERQLGVINPDEKTTILAARLLQLNTQYTDAQNDRIRKETEYRALESVTPSSLSSAALEVSPQAEALERLAEQVREAQQKLVDAKTIYGPNYAEYKRAANDVAEVTRQYEQLRLDISKRIEVEYREAQRHEDLLRVSLAMGKDESDKLNANSSQYQELKREAEANKTLYDELFRKIKEAGINGAFEGSAIRIADEARPQLYPVFPKKSLFIMLSMILSLLGSIIVVLLADLFDRSLRDPEQTRRLTGIEVLGMLPHVNNFPTDYAVPRLQGGSSEIVAKRILPGQGWFSTSEFYRESISTLLSTVLLNRAESRPRSLLITSAGPREGKSSCAAHLALAHAGQGKRTLLIDADLRSPFQHRYFRMENAGGLAEAITNTSPLPGNTHKVEGFPLLDVVVAGTAIYPVFNQVGIKVAELIERATTEYDLVIIDAPPMLGLAEPVEISCFADGVLVVARAGRTSEQAVTTAISTLQRVNANVLGLVLNQVRLDMSETYKQYRGYSPYAQSLATRTS